MTKIIYLLDPTTGAFMGESLHPLDPVETERAGEPVYALLNPLLAVEDAPPSVPADMRAVRFNDAWTLEPLPEPPEPEAPDPDLPPLPEPTDPPELTFEERMAALRAHVQQYMDAMADALGYDDIKTAVSYAEEPAVPKFQNEGRAFRAWRSLVRAALDDLLDRVRAGEAEEPTADQLPDLLPRLELPVLEDPETPDQPEPTE